MIFRNKPFLFNTNHLDPIAKDHSEQYLGAEPFPHIVIDDFLPKHVAQSALKCFPSPDSTIWLDWRKRDTVHQPKKLGIGHASRLIGVDSYLLQLLNSFNSYPFLNFLEKLTGISKLLPDPYFYGGGVHQILNGGKLDIHADFNHLKKLDIYRRINVLFYLNKNWNRAYGGNLELWNDDMTRCEKVIEPIFNRVVIFNTDKLSYHGHPEPLKMPKKSTRKSIALYYYTSQPDTGRVYNEATDWKDIG